MTLSYKTHQHAITNLVVKLRVKHTEGLRQRQALSIATGRLYDVPVSRSTNECIAMNYTYFKIFVIHSITQEIITIPLLARGQRGRKGLMKLACRKVRHEAHFVEPILAVRDGEPTEISGHPRLRQKYVAS